MVGVGEKHLVHHRFCIFRLLHFSSFHFVTLIKVYRVIGVKQSNSVYWKYAITFSLSSNCCIFISSSFNFLFVAWSTNSCREITGMLVGAFLENQHLFLHSYGSHVVPRKISVLVQEFWEYIHTSYSALSLLWIQRQVVLELWPDAYQSFKFTTEYPSKGT